jgi:hypothetical protein
MLLRFTFERTREILAADATAYIVNYSFAVLRRSAVDRFQGCRAEFLGRVGRRRRWLMFS